MKSFNVLVLPGDGVGPEVMTEALKVMHVIEAKGDVKFNITQELVGADCFEKHGVPIRREVLDLAKKSDAVLFGSEGGAPLGQRKINYEGGLLQLRRELDVYANIRPISFIGKSLYHMSALPPDKAKGTNFLIVRENTGGAYFGKKVETEDYGEDTWAYSRHEVERVSRVAAALAGLGHTPPLLVTSCDKANVLASGKLWRRVVTETFAKEFPEIKLSHQLADSAAMLMIKDPTRFNGIMLTENTIRFGDILSDEASGITGSIGLSPSASLSGAPNETGVQGLYEPIHGTAPDIAGKGVVNPVGQILAMAMMLRWSFNLKREADAIEKAVAKVLDSKAEGGLEVRTGDIGGTAKTSEMGDAICQVLKGILG
ncbi:hypothetical protein B7463_g12571, partial [Scytalidium lignicola]